MHTYFQAISNPWKRDLNLWQFDTSYVVTGAHHGGLTWKLHISDPLCKETPSPMRSFDTFFVISLNKPL